MRWTRTVRYTRVRIAAAVPLVGIGLALGGIDPDACNMRWNGAGAVQRARCADCGLNRAAACWTEMHGGGNPNNSVHMLGKGSIRDPRMRDESTREHRRSTRSSWSTGGGTNGYSYHSNATTGRWLNVYGTHLWRYKLMQADLSTGKWTL